MIVELVGGPLDGELRDIPEDRPLGLDLAFYRGNPLARPTDEHAPVPITKGAYEWRTWSKDDRKYLVWQGEA